MKRRCFLSLILLFAVLVMPAQGDTEPVLVKLGTVLGIDHPACQSLTYFQRKIGEMLDNPIRIHIFPDSQLGTTHDLLEGLRFGDIEMGILPTDVLASLAPLLSAVSMPYIFRDDGHRFRVLDGPIGIKLLDLLKNNNLIGLGFFDTGMKNVVTKQQHIVKPEHLQGLKIGVITDRPEDDCQNIISQLSGDSLTAQGAVIEPMNPGEVYDAFQSDRIGGWEGTEPECVFFKIFETGAIYFTYTKHTSVPDVLVASKIWFDSLSPEMQHALQKVARLTVRQQRQLWEECVQNAIAQLEAAGMKFEAIDREPFYTAVQPVYTKMYERLGPGFEELVQTIMAVK
jgi:TRAP-type C4-dicarboxylate transport system substrate-binding protein